MMLHRLRVALNTLIEIESYTDYNFSNNDSKVKNVNNMGIMLTSNGDDKHITDIKRTSCKCN